MLNIEIYAADNCRMCRRAKSLLDERGLAYTEIDVSHDRTRLREMIARSGRHSVPQIFVNDRAIGGYHELSRVPLPRWLR